MIKKLFNIFLTSILLFVSCFSVHAVSDSKYSAVQPSTRVTSEGILEDYELIYNKKYLEGINVKYTIPEDYSSDSILIVPHIFDYLSEYKSVMPGDEIKINIKIENLSEYEYEYDDQSFILSTEDMSFYESLYGLTKSGNAIGFNGIPIYTMYQPFRTGNTALKSLLGENFSKSKLSNEELDTVLKDEGYSGIDELNKYYLDYYNNKYQLSASKLEDFPDKVVKELFEGNRYDIREDNDEIVELSYNWFYNKLFSVTFVGDNYSDDESEIYSIGSYMRDKSKGNVHFNNAFGKLEKNKEYDINDIKLHINGPYTVNTYQLYPFSAYIEFSFHKIVIDEPVEKPVDEPIEEPDDSEEEIPETKPEENTGDNDQKEETDEKSDESIIQDNSKLEPIFVETDDDIIIPPDTGI